MENDVKRRYDNAILGVYPQSRERDAETIRRLNEQAGKLPTRTNSQKWTSYHFYDEDGDPSDYAWHIDLTIDGRKYRGVYFVEYRPAVTSCEEDGYYPEASVQKANGYLTKKTYWFRFEPIEWVVLTQDDKYAMVISDKILDAGNFGHKSDLKGWSYRFFRQKKIPNFYGEGDLHSFLHETFSNVAFTPNERSKMIQIEVDNGPYSTFPNEKKYWKKSDGTNVYAKGDTLETLFSPSVQEVTDALFGFSPDPRMPDPARRKRATDYARAMGVGVIQGNAEESGNSMWWLRSPDRTSDEEAHCISADGVVEDRFSVFRTYPGIVPGFWMKLS